MGGLTAAAVVHAMWAAGSTWPAKDSDHLADLVVGARPFPSSPLTWLVTGLIGSAAAVTAMATTGSGNQRGRWARRGTRLVAGGLLLRGVAGFTTSALETTDATPLYRRWDLRLYSPLCVVLGTTAAVAAGRARR